MFETNDITSCADSSDVAAVIVHFPDENMLTKTSAVACSSASFLIYTPSCLNFASLVHGASRYLMLSTLPERGGDSSRLFSNFRLITDPCCS